VAHFSVPTLLPHTGIHGDLAPYYDLMLWQKMEWLENTDHDNRFGSIQEGYCKAMQKAYEVEVAQYIEDLKNRVMGKKPEGKKHHHHHGNVYLFINLMCFIFNHLILLYSAAISVMGDNFYLPSTVVADLGGVQGFHRNPPPPPLPKFLDLPTAQSLLQPPIVYIHNQGMAEEQHT